MGTEELTSQLRPDPCKDCTKKEVDDWGLFCDLACGKASAYDNYLCGAKDMFNSISYVLKNTKCKYQGKKAQKYFRLGIEEVIGVLREWIKI